MIGEFISTNICVFICCLMPAYKTFKHLKNENADPKLHQELLQYWISVAFLSMAVSYIEFFLSFLPFYYEAKIVVCFWLANLTGAQIIFNNYLAPFLIQHEDQIDEQVRQIKTSAYSTIVTMGANAFVAMQKAVMQGIMEGQRLLLQKQFNAMQNQTPTSNNPSTTTSTQTPSTPIAPVSHTSREEAPSNVPLDSEFEEIPEGEEEEEETVADVKSIKSSEKSVLRTRSASTTVKSKTLPKNLATTVKKTTSTSATTTTATTTRPRSSTATNIPKKLS